MSEPEIARRCTNCGAAVRGQAKFCPQCGAGRDELAAAGKAAAGQADSPPVAPPPAAEEKPAADVLNRTRAFSGEEYLALSDELARQRARAKEVDENYGATVLPSKDQKADLRALAAQVRVKMQAKESERAAPEQRPPGEQAHTPGAQEGVPGAQESARGERLREVSFVLLDEANNDPTLRFVLVVIVLFVLFLLILLFSHILD
jgi:hypothetical protein